MDAINCLPFGVIKLSAAGTVEFYSAREAELWPGCLAGPGNGFFTRIAPCMNTPQFRGLIDSAVANGKLDAEFSHVGDFSNRDRGLAIRAQSASDGRAWLFLTRMAR